MAISLYDISVASYLQTVAAVGGFLEKGLAFCREKNIDPEEIVESRIFPDMKPFRFQIQQVAMHSIGAIESLKAGVRRPPGERPMHDYAGLQTLIKEADAALRKLTPAEIDKLEGTKSSWRWARASASSRRKDSSSPSRCPIFIFTRRPPTTFCAAKACLSASAITWEPCGSRRSS